MPWNFPFWQVIRFIVPNILLANTCLLKHAENVQGCAQALIDLINQPVAKPLVQNIRLGNDDVAKLLEIPQITGVSLTGSDHAGRIVAQAAGLQLKKCVLELGGSDAFIVLKDANLEEAVNCAVKSRFINNGQSCIAAKRFIIEREIYDAFLFCFEKKIRALKLGDPLKSTTDIGPLAKKGFVDKIHQQVQLSLKQGGRLVCGGQPDKGFYLPTLIADVDAANIANKEEIFGPVACVFPVENPQQALALANNNPYGLGATIWTQDKARAESMTNALEVGLVAINTMVQSALHLPFGGCKRSGIGRELGLEGAKEFALIKSQSWLK